MAYNTGPGKALPLANFCQPSTLPKLIHCQETNDAVSLITVKSRQQTEQTREQQGNDPIQDEINVERAKRCTKLFLCLVEDCIMSFQKYSFLEKHMMVLDFLK